VRVPCSPVRAIRSGFAVVIHNELEIETAHRGRSCDREFRSIQYCDADGRAGRFRSFDADFDCPIWYRWIGVDREAHELDAHSPSDEERDGQNDHAPDAHLSYITIR